MESLKIWQFFAGVALFVYAMSLIESSLKNLAGRSFKKFLRRYSKNRISLLASTTVITGILQSSSVVLLIILSFVGAGLLRAPDALAASLGTNLGTTLDSWVIAMVGFKINFYSIAFPVLTCSLVGLLSFKSKSSWKYVTTLLIGFSFVFIGLEWMKGSLDKSAYSLLKNFENWHYLAFIPLGFILTSVIQSSSAAVAITLTALSNQVLFFEQALCLVLGSELGTTMKFLIASAGGLPEKKRVAWGNFMMNLVVIVISASLLKPIIYLIQEVIGVTDLLTGLVFFQSGINIFSILLFLPMLNSISHWLEKIIKDRDVHSLTRFIHRKPVALPSDTLELAEKEIEAALTDVVFLNAGYIGCSAEMGPVVAAHKLAERYNEIKWLEGEILEYLSMLRSEEMNETEIIRREQLITIVRHLLRAGKNVKDIYHNMQEFESTANDRLFASYQEVRKRMALFYENYLKVLKLEIPDAVRMHTLLIENRQEYDRLISEWLVYVHKGEISEMDSADFLNVYREIYSANKALILSLAELRKTDMAE